MSTPDDDDVSATSSKDLFVAWLLCLKDAILGRISASFSGGYCGNAVNPATKSGFVAVIPTNNKSATPKYIDLNRYLNTRPNNGKFGKIKSSSSKRTLPSYRYAADAQPQRLLKVRAHKKSCRAARFISQGRAIVTGSPDCLILATDVETRAKVVHLENAHSAPVNQIINLTEATIASGDDAGCVKEASSWLYEIFLQQFPLGFLPVVLYWWNPMWLFSVSDIRLESMAKIVSAYFNFKVFTWFETQ
ncbi:uncharacterized protein LOC141607880 [Silene latifolia]|uniref:uncharacterized protein LOC141607880 n=1 Tax=Silene latifolia TaxID=37657 RepID=UPI003D770514